MKKNSFSNYSFEKAKLPILPEDEIAAQIQLAELKLKKNTNVPNIDNNPEVLKVIDDVKNLFLCYKNDPSKINN